jgi:hypothetical protein
MPKKNMGKFIRYNIVVVVLLLVISCKTTQATSTENPDQYFKVSLYSIGTGIDHEAEAIVINTIDKYKKKGFDISYTTSSWGREGEKDYCIQAEKLKPEAYKQLFDEISTLLKDKQAHVNKKQECIHSH